MMTSRENDPLMFGQKEEIDHVLGNQLNELRERMLIVCRFQSKKTYFLAKTLPSLVF